jgi:hypothetical protein
MIKKSKTDFGDKSAAADLCLLNHGCQIFLGETYQKGGNVPN